MACTCLPRSPDDQCPTHGYDTWDTARKEARHAEEMQAMSQGDAAQEGEGHTSVPTLRKEAEWLSQCCGAPPHQLTPDVGEAHPAGICGQCGGHTGFERA